MPEAAENTFCGERTGPTSTCTSTSGGGAGRLRTLHVYCVLVAVHCGHW